MEERNQRGDLRKRNRETRDAPKFVVAEALSTSSQSVKRKVRVDILKQVNAFSISIGICTH